MNSRVLQRQKRERARGRVLLLLVFLVVLAGVAWWWQRQTVPSAGNRVGDTVTGVASVIDGDTLDIRGVKIRLFGVDAPEASQTCQRARRTYPCGREAANELSSFLGGQPITCQRRDTDRYGRMVAVCHRGTEDVNGWLVRGGLALAYREYSTAYVSQENAARKAKRGIHAGSFVNPGDYRKGQTTAAPATTPRRTPYANCAQARAAGQTPVLKDEPGFNPKLDGDKDGKMCE